MDEKMKIAFKKSLNKFNFSSTMSVAIDSNVNIKTILSTHAYLYDEKIECGNGKAIMTGRIGLKVLYVDTDGISNTITDSQAVSENIIDSALTTDSFVAVSNKTIVSNVISSDGVLKVNCDVSLIPVLFLNIPISNNYEQDENTICKKSELTTSVISANINSNFKHITTFETKDKISKILCYNSYFSISNYAAKDNSIYVQGKLFSSVLYETDDNGEIRKKELIDTFNVATEIDVTNISSECELELYFDIDKNSENISTEIEDDNSIITIQNQINVCGVAVKNINIEVVDDMFSTKNELEIATSEREFLTLKKCEFVSSKIYGETSLNDDEPAIEELISNLNISPEITNAYIKNGTLQVEGIISSHLVYIDENKACQHKHIEVPFIVDTKIQTENSNFCNENLNILDCKIKIKRGTIIEVEYAVEMCIHSFNKDQRMMINNVTKSKEINFGNYDYQIYLAKPGETRWELCKRIKISLEQLELTNKNLPLVMNGGEKIIIKR